MQSVWNRITLIRVAKAHGLSLARANGESTIQPLSTLVLSFPQFLLHATIVLAVALSYLHVGGKTPTVL